MEAEEPLSDDPKENLRLENELIKIKLKAQFGEGFKMESHKGLSPELEHQFLKNVMAFEEQYSKVNKTTVFEKIGSIKVKPFTEMDTDSLKNVNNQLISHLEKHGIYLHFNHGPYPDESVFRFITEDIFKIEVPKKTIPGITQNFTYEEFYPNHKAEILKNAHEFLCSWFTRNIDITSTELSWYCINQKGEKYTREDLLVKIRNFFNSFETFKDDGYNIADVQYQLPLENHAGMGFAEGICKYNAVMDNGKAIHFEGPYKLYFEMEENWWSIFYFIIPGFEC